MNTWEEDDFEVLAPAGSLPDLQVMLSARPDAIYVGLKGHSSRPSFSDLSIADIEKAISLCHREGIKLYVAINSKVSEADFRDVVSEIRQLDKSGADAFILSDFGLIRALSNSPIQAEIHASTLLGACNVPTVIILKELGVSRIILYATLYLDEMVNIINAVPDLDYELVAEGGTCFNDIRQCRLPHFVSGREHVLTCRSGCILFDANGNAVKGKALAEHPCRVSEVIGIYMAAGIRSFKVEGRTVAANERIQNVRDLQLSISRFLSGPPLNAYLHYINRLRREVI
jgi:hypothetical protein